MKSGSTIEDLYVHLKGRGYVGGMFVRAEGVGIVGGKGRQMRKDEVLGRECRIIKIMTNKNRAHEKDEVGGGGGKGGGDRGDQRARRGFCCFHLNVLLILPLPYGFLFPFPQIASLGVHPSPSLGSGNFPVMV